MKVFFRTIHLYLSLLAGLVIGAVCFSGAALVFEKEMQMSFYPERYQVAKGREHLSIERMTAALKEKMPEAKVTSVRIHGDPERSVELGYGERREDSRQAYVNPYTGELIGIHTARLPFFATMFELHRWLLVREPGKLIVGISTLIFLVILITGIILWWPKNMAIVRSRLKLKWNAGWKRINHDLHIVVGFYTAIFLFIFAFTGLAWSFDWFNEGIYRITGSNKPPKPPQSAVREGAAPVSFDLAYAHARRAVPDAEYYNISAPRDSAATIRITAMPEDAPHERASVQIHVDQYSGELLAVQRFEEGSLGQRVRSTFYPVHVGSIGGLPGRIIAFISCVAGFTFPITGVVLWINRLRKKRRGVKKERRVDTIRKKIEVEESVIS